MQLKRITKIPEQSHEPEPLWSTGTPHGSKPHRPNEFLSAARFHSPRPQIGQLHEGLQCDLELGRFDDAEVAAGITHVGTYVNRCCYGTGMVERVLRYGRAVDYVEDLALDEVDSIADFHARMVERTDGSGDNLQFCGKGFKIFEDDGNFWLGRKVER